VNPHVRALGVRAAAVRGRDGGDDREAEPCAASRSCAVRAGEALERDRRELGRQALALVGHVELDDTRAGDGTQTDLAAAVALGVVHQVAERLLEARAVGMDAQGTCLFRLRAKAGSHGRKEVGHVDVLGAQGQPSVVRPRDHQQVLGEPDQAVGLLPCRLERGAKFLGRPAAPQSQIDLGLENRERGAQLVARVGHEGALPRERRLEPVEHLVECLPQPRQLVSRLGDR